MEHLEDFLHKLVHHSSAPEGVKNQMHDEIDGVEGAQEPPKFDPDTGEPLNGPARDIRAKANAPADAPTPETGEGATPNA